MAFSSYCRRLVNGSSSLITSRIVGSQIRSKHSVSRAQNSQVISSKRPLRQFVTSKGKSAGRNSAGRITIFHRGGGAKRLQRTIDLKRNSSSVGVVERIEYDPNRTSRIAVVRWVKTADIAGQNKTNKLEEFDPPRKIFDPNTNAINGQFSFSSMPGMMDQKKVVCAAPTLDHVIVPRSKNPVTNWSKSPFTKMATPKDVFLSAFSSSKKDNARYSFVSSLGLPRMAIAGAKPSFFVAKMKDDLSPNEVKKWDKDSDAWAHKIKRKAAVTWQSLRRQEILGLAGLADHNESKLKLKEIDEKKKKDGKFKLDRAPVTYVLATHQMTPGKMVMNCDSSKRSNKELMRGY